MTTGLVLGKFYPPHKGHMKLIEYAKSGCDRLIVLIADSDAGHESFPLIYRQQIIRAEFPDTVNVKILCTRDNNPTDYNSDKVWQAHVDVFKKAIEGIKGAKSLNYLFSSEEYGWRLAEMLGCTHVMFDPKRCIVPISATEVRNNFRRNSDYLTKKGSELLAKRFVVCGAESTGTTTLATDLYDYMYGTLHGAAELVQEYGRYYAKIAGEDHTWVPEDFLNIAHKQNCVENWAASNAKGRPIICDTNALVTTVFENMYLNTSEPVSMKEARLTQEFATVYLVTDLDCPFRQDGTRQESVDREAFTKLLIERIEASGKPYYLMRGDKTERLEHAVAIYREEDRKSLRFSKPI